MQSSVLTRIAVGNWLVQSRTRAFWIPAVLGVLLCSAVAVAQQAPAANDSDRQMIEELRAEVHQLETRVAQLESERQTTSTPQSPAAPAASQQQVPSAEPEVAHEVEPQRMDTKTLMNIRGFGDVTFHGNDLKGSHTAFTLGQLNLFVTSDISEKFRFLSEIVFEADPTNAVGVDVERLLLQYSHNDYFNFAVGRYHTDIGFYNTAYHHAAWLQTAVSRPFLYQFEDNGGILPIHNVGATISGMVPSGKVGLHYVVEVGNGRASHSPLAEAVQNVVDENNGKSVNVAVFARPSAVRGLQLGFSAYHDGLQPLGAARVGETILAAHAVMQRPNFEWLNEALLIRHSVDGGHVFDTPGFYSQISKAFGAYRPYFRYQYVNASDAEPIFPYVGLMYGPSVGMRFDASEAVALKLQYDRTDFRNQTAVNGLTLQFAFTF